VSTHFLEFDDVVPLGFSAENAITCLKNADYKHKDEAPEFGAEKLCKL
jgi:hypothetical protein